MLTDVYKFGGASVGSAAGVRNVAEILLRSGRGKVVVVVSAMGKTTNALEEVLGWYMAGDAPALVEAFRKVKEDHFAMVRDLFPDPEHPVFGEVESLFDQMRGIIRKGHLYTPGSLDYDREYDQIVSLGEMISTTIVHHYLQGQGLPSRLFDVRELISTDETFRDARVDWPATREKIIREVGGYFTATGEAPAIALTQGFLGRAPSGLTTTLGREGSDFSAAIFAWCLGSREMTIWKDVPGVMNADPRWMPDAVQIETLSYREAIELAYYGASVIHPKTIKPLENGNITLWVKSFQRPDLPGTRVMNLKEWTIGHPIFIRKKDQTLISVSPRDFSFILEENLSQIFGILATFRVKVNLMHNSAISFSICIDHDPRKTAPLISYLKRDFETRYNEGLELCTIRHYGPAAIERVTEGRIVMMEVRSRNTIQLVTRKG